MPATLLYTVLLGIIYVVKKNWHPIHPRWSKGVAEAGKQRLNRDSQGEVNNSAVMELRKENTTLKEVVAELT